MTQPPPEERHRTASSSWVLVGIVWALVAIPLLWGIWTTLKKSLVLFR